MGRKDGAGAPRIVSAERRRAGKTPFLAARAFRRRGGARAPAEVKTLVLAARQGAGPTETRVPRRPIRRLLGVTGCCGGGRREDSWPDPFFRGTAPARRHIRGASAPDRAGNPGPSVSLAPRPDCAAGRASVQTAPARCHIYRGR